MKCRKGRGKKKKKCVFILVVGRIGNCKKCLWNINYGIVVDIVLGCVFVFILKCVFLFLLCIF